MGLPNLVLVLANNQTGVAAELDEKGIARSLGRWEQVQDEEICQTLHSLLEDRKRRKEMSHRGRCLVDGKGAERVVAWLTKENYEACIDR